MTVSNSAPPGLACLVLTLSCPPTSPDWYTKFRLVAGADGNHYSVRPVRASDTGLFFARVEMEVPIPTRFPCGVELWPKTCRCRNLDKSDAPAHGKLMVSKKGIA